MSTGVETDDVVEPWLWTTLAEDAELNTMVGGLIVNAAEDQVDPEWTAYIIFSFIDARDIRGIGTTRTQVDALYLVKAVVRGGDYGPAGDIFRRICQLLEVEQTVTTSTGDLTCTRETITKYPERQDGTQYRHLGGTFRIRVNS